MSEPTDTWKFHGKNVLRGILMGCADVVPGVSGGTVALILGIYTRLVTAISHVDLGFIQLLRARQWRRAARHVDLAFLGSLASGIAIGIVVMSTLMHSLLSTEASRALTMAMFFGLILASGVIVALMIEITARRQLVPLVGLGVAGAAFAWWVAGLSGTNSSHPHLLFIFCCATVAIVAMILPGISGAMVLLILGVYVHMTAIPGNLLRGVNVSSGIITLAVFAAGCAVGLIGFSKLLRWLLAHHHGTTMAVLCGFMFGSLRKLWPFQVDTTPHIEEVKFKVFRSVLPTALDVQTMTVIAVIVAAAAAVWLIDWYTFGHLRRLTGRRTG